MISNYIALFMNLLTADISILLAAKGMQVDYNEDENSSRLSKILFSGYKKKTRMQFFPLVCNLLLTFVSGCMEIIGLVDDNADFVRFVERVTHMVSVGYHKILWGLLGVVILTIVFMLLTYRAVGLKPHQDAENGNRHLNANEVNDVYISFSTPENIDARSTLLLLAGDLTFLGDVPDLDRISKKDQRQKCTDLLINNESACKCQTKKCPLKLDKCNAKSSQFNQLIDLHNCGVKLRIICKKPKANGDVVYKRRLGRLKKIFRDDLEIRFLSDQSVAHDICVLGRIKQNGGIDELLWHRKSTHKKRTYTVPNIKRSDTSENKTLICLLSKVLWEVAEIASEDMVNEYVEEYEGAFQQVQKTS